MNGKKEYRCRKCEKPFSHSGNCRRHERKCDSEAVVRKEKETEFICTRSWCEQVFSRKANRDRHSNLFCKRKVNDSNVCYLCHASFSRQTHLKRHLLLHSENRFKKTYKCRKCKKVYKKKKSLLSHEKKCIVNLEDPVSMVNPFDNTTDERNESDLDVTNNGSIDVTGERYDGDLDVSNNGSIDVTDERYDGDLDVTNIGSIDITGERYYYHDGNLDITYNSSNDVTGERGDGSNNDMDEREESNLVDFTNDDGSNSISDERIESESADLHNDVDGNSNVKESEAVINDDTKLSYTCDFCGDVFEKVWAMYRHKKLCNPEVQDNLVHLAKSVLRTFQLQIQQSKRCLSKKIEVAKQLKGFLDRNDFLDEKYFNWLGKELKLGDDYDVKMFLRYADKSVDIGGRPDKISEETKLKVVNYWKDHCQISVDRRNNRQVVRMKLKKMPKIVKKILKYDEKISIVDTKRGKKYEGHRHVYTSSVRKLFNDFTKSTGIKISIGSFLNLKPFYIVPPTTREMASCLCIKCLNIHLIYDTIRLHKKDLPASLTEYLTSKMECSIDEQIDFVKLECIRSECKNACKIVYDNSLETDVNANYYVFEKVLTVGWNREGKRYEYERTGRVNKVATMKELHEYLQEGAEAYLEHRYNVAADKVFWKEFCAVCEKDIFHIDYSENIKFKPKFEAQSAHFSGRQHTLHCCVHQKADDINYVYHLSDDTNHDNVMTKAIIEDMIVNRVHDDSDTIILRSDNCSTQFKSQYVFASMRSLALKHNIKIVWFYGEPGHGRGLVDAMSSFGCKGPLRKLIINEDQWYDNVEEMKVALEDHFKGDKQKSYRLVDPNGLRLARMKRKGYEIKGCKKMHMICVDKSGTFYTKELLHVSDKSLFSFDFENDDIGDYRELADDEEREAENLDDYVLSTDILYEVIEASSYIGLRIDAEEDKSSELFYVVEVLEKGEAPKNIETPTSCIFKGERYVKVQYLQKSHESSKHVQYCVAKKFLPAYVNLAEIFTTNIELDNKLRMHINEYRSICSQL